MIELTLRLAGTLGTSHQRLSHHLLPLDLWGTDMSSIWKHPRSQQLYQIWIFLIIYSIPIFQSVIFTLQNQDGHTLPFRNKFHTSSSCPPPYHSRFFLSLSGPQPLRVMVIEQGWRRVSLINSLRLARWGVPCEQWRSGRFFVVGWVWKVPLKRPSPRRKGWKFKRALKNKSWFLFDNKEDVGSWEKSWIVESFISMGDHTYRVSIYSRVRCHYELSITTRKIFPWHSKAVACWESGSEDLNYSTVGDSENQRFFDCILIYLAAGRMCCDNLVWKEPSWLNVIMEHILMSRCVVFLRAHTLPGVVSIPNWSHVSGWAWRAATQSRFAMCAGRPLWFGKDWWKWSIYMGDQWKVQKIPSKFAMLMFD